MKPGQLPRGSERGSLQSPCEASHGIRQFSLGPTLKKHIKQIDGVQRRAAHFVKNFYTREPGTVTNLLNNNIKLDTPEGMKNNLAVNLIPQSNSWWWRPGLPRLCYEGTLAKTSLLNRCQILRHIRIVLFVELSRTGMSYQAKFLTLSRQIVSKKSYLSILVDDEF